MSRKLILAECRKYGLLRNQAAYVLATADWETNHTFKPVKEAYWLKNAERWRKRNLRYWPWYGRGFAQLTWEENYIKAGKKLGLDLTSNPDVVMQPAIAAKILVLGMKEGWFTGKCLSNYITLERSRFTDARRIVNGTDEAVAIALLARTYNKELKAQGYGVEPHSESPTVKAPKPAPPTPKQPAKRSGGLVGAIKAVIAAILKGLRS